MLHSLFPQLADHLRAEVPALGTIDLDMAQLDYQSNEPIAYPAVYIDLENIPWEDRGQGVQTGKALLRFTVAVEVSEETYQGSGQRNPAMERLLVIQQVHDALQHHQGTGFGPLVRTSYRRDRPQHPEAWCLAMGYVSEVTDVDGAYDLKEIRELGLAERLGRRPIAAPEKGGYVLPNNV